METIIYNIYAQWAVASILFGIPYSLLLSRAVSLLITNTHLRLMPVWFHNSVRAVAIIHSVPAALAIAYGNYAPLTALGVIVLALTAYALNHYRIGVVAKNKILSGELKPFQLIHN